MSLMQKTVRLIAFFEKILIASLKTAKHASNLKKNLKFWLCAQAKSPVCARFNETIESFFTRF